MQFGIILMYGHQLPIDGLRVGQFSGIRQQFRQITLRLGVCRREFDAALHLGQRFFLLALSCQHAP